MAKIFTPALHSTSVSDYVERTEKRNKLAQRQQQRTKQNKKLRNKNLVGQRQQLYKCFMFLRNLGDDVDYVHDTVKCWRR